jgi:hypothetical protein
MSRFSRDNLNGILCINTCIRIYIKCNFFLCPDIIDKFTVPCSNFEYYCVLRNVFLKNFSHKMVYISFLNSISSSNRLR